MARVGHFDFSATDPAKLMSFYQDIFGWKFEKAGMPDMDYWLVTTGPDKEPGINGGMTKRFKDNSILNTIIVENIDATLKKITGARGKITQPKGPIPGVGWYAQFTDPQDNSFGVLQADPSAK